VPTNAPLTGAVLLAAGRGKRLRPHTDTTPKPLLPVNGAPTLDLYCRGLVTANVQNVVLVAHHLAEQITDYGDTINQRFGLSCTTVIQEKLDGTASAVEAVITATNNSKTTDTSQQILRSTMNGSFLLMATDYLIPPSFIPDLLAFHSSHNDDISISIKSVPQEQLSSRSSVRFTDDGLILEIVEKPAEGQAPSKFSTNLAYVLPPAITSYLTDVTHSPRGEREVQSAINAFLSSGGTARGIEQAAPSEWSPDTRN